jgi:hypothetical protein
MSESEKPPSTFIPPTPEAVREAVEGMERDVAEAMARYPRPAPRHCPTCRCWEQP